MKAIAGTVYFKVDGTQYSVAGPVTCSLGDTTREILVGHDGVHGVKEMPKVPFVEVQIRDFPDVDLNKVEKLKDVTITVELISGKVGTLREAWQVNGIELNSEDGTYTLRFEGKSGEWQVAA